jgi:hypothetical protein
VGSIDLLSEPEESDGPEQASADAERLRPRPRDLPDPDERGRVYEATRSHVEAGATEPPEQVSESGQLRDGTDQRGYWAEVPRFARMWADHDRRWPTERPPAAADGSPDPPGSHRIDGGFYLSPERHAEVADAINQVGKAEAPISADMQRAERENTSGGWLEGSEFRLKGDDRLKEKVAEYLEAEPRKAASEALGKIPDAIRYTFCFQPESYTRGYYDIKARLEGCGHEMYLSKNSWGHQEYKGINTRWVTQEGQRFEVQFHTPESFHAKQNITHVSYEKIRNSFTSDGERMELRKFQREVSAAIRVPDGAAEIPDYKKEGF